jgi:hypothetical protein
VVEFLVPSYISKPEDAPQAVNDLGRSIAFSIQQINDIVTTPSRLVTATLSTTARPVAHNLGYICRGFVVVKKTASFDVYEDSAAANPDSKRYAMLRTSAGTESVTILFF